jgi:2-amino-4-hydroxy-6-hydroxymethyldihydropteridine diphosphokinase
MPAPTPSGAGPKRSSEIRLDAVIGLGSNLGTRLDSLRFAVDQLRAITEVVAVSAVYETKAVGPPQPDYLNAALRLLSSLEPESLLESILSIEQRAGRERRERWGPRCLDLDVLWIRDRCVDGPNLTVPHPELSRRAFAVVPLLDVAPEAADPRTGILYADLLRGLDVTGLTRVASRFQLLPSEP